MRKNTLKDFWKKVDVRGPNDCWEWQACKFKSPYECDRYGVWSFRGKTYRAHRWIYEQTHNKTLPTNIVVCHSCDNPSCVNPNHLWEGTQTDNIRDRDKKGRFVDHWNF